MSNRRKGPDEPSSKRKGKAGIFVAAAIIAIIVAIFVSYNVSHVNEMDNEKTGVAQRKGLNGD